MRVHKDLLRCGDCILSVLKQIRTQVQRDGTNKVAVNIGALAKAIDAADEVVLLARSMQPTREAAPLD